MKEKLYMIRLLTCSLAACSFLSLPVAAQSVTGKVYLDGNTRAYNGFMAVRALVDDEWRRLKDLSEDALWAAVVKVRNQNYKFNHEFTKVDGKNQYNLNI